MKINMWMIANRLYHIDSEINITGDDPLVLKSARRMQAQDCVYIYENGRDIICQAQSGTIRLKDIKISEAFEIVQDVFDFYEDWYSDLKAYIKQKNYQAAVDRCQLVFHNPLILLDASCKLLGMSSSYDKKSMDEEWNYLSEHGFSSIYALQLFHSAYSNVDFTLNRNQEFYFNNRRVYGNHLVRGVWLNDLLAARLILLEKDKKINPGDHTLFDVLADTISESITFSDLEEDSVVQNMVFPRLCLGKFVPDDTLERELNYLSWKADDFYQIILVHARGNEITPKIETLYEMSIRLLCPLGRIVKINCNLLIIWNYSRHGDFSRSDIAPIYSQIDLLTVKSLFLKGIKSLYYLQQQTLEILAMPELWDTGTQKSPHINFHDIATHYIFLSSNIHKIYHACHPDIILLREHDKQCNDNLLETFSVYLDYNCSIKETASVLFIHRNTLIYRIQKINDLIHTDYINNPYERKYMSMSIQILSLYKLKTGYEI